VPRATSPASALPRAERADIDAVTFQPVGRSESMTWAQSLAANYTDGMLVLHRGRIVYERSFGALTAALKNQSWAEPNLLVSRHALGHEELRPRLYPGRSLLAYPCR